MPGQDRVLVGHGDPLDNGVADGVRLVDEVVPEGPVAFHTAR